MPNMENSNWAEESDKQANEIFEALNAEKDREAELRFDDLTRLTRGWCSGYLNRNGIDSDEVDDFLPKIWMRLWRTILRKQIQGQPLESVRAMLKHIIRCVVTDYLREINPNYERVQQNIRIICNRGNFFAIWMDRNIKLIGRTQWQNKSIAHNKSFDEWHRAKIRLELDERLAALPKQKLSKQVLAMLEVTFEIYASPIRLREFEAMCLDFLHLESLAPISISSETSAPELADGQPSIETTVIGELEGSDIALLIKQMKTTLSNMSAEKQESVLLKFNRDVLACYCAPENSVNVLTPLHQEAFKSWLIKEKVEAAFLAVQDVGNVPIPDDEIGRRMDSEGGKGKTKEAVQALRFRTLATLRKARLEKA